MDIIKLKTYQSKYLRGLANMNVNPERLELIKVVTNDFINQVKQEEENNGKTNADVANNSDC